MRLMTAPAIITAHEHQGKLVRPPDSKRRKRDGGHGGAGRHAHGVSVPKAREDGLELAIARRPDKAHAAPDDVGRTQPTTLPVVQRAGKPHKYHDSKKKLVRERAWQHAKRECKAQHIHKLLPWLDERGPVLLQHLREERQPEAECPEAYHEQ